jgi:hypothetical protein
MARAELGDDRESGQHEHHSAGNGMVVLMENITENVGASALKIPNRLKATNPATPTARNSALPASGRPKPTNRRDSR